MNNADVNVEWGETKMARDVSIKHLDGMEGSLTELVKAYLDAKGADYKIATKDENSDVMKIRGIDPFIEPGSVMIGKSTDAGSELMIVEELDKVCGVSGRFHKTHDTRVDSIIDRADYVTFTTYKNSRDLTMSTSLEARMSGIYFGGGRTSIRMPGVLKDTEPADLRRESFQVKCECNGGRLECKANVF